MSHRTCMTRLAALAILAAACAPAPVESVTLTPTGDRAGEIAAALRAADARWEAAGVAPERILIGGGGAPVRFAPTPEGYAGVTHLLFRDRVFAGVDSIDLSSADVDVVAHELGHALGIGWPMLDDDHAPEEVCAHAPEPHRPVMCGRGGVAITAADLDMACGAGTCDHFSPETLEG